MYQLNGYEISINHVLEQAKTYIKNPDSLAIIERAFELAFQKHKDQLRKSGEPYIIHPIEVAYILAKWQTGPRTIASGLLHDIIEDTEITKEEISELFDEEIAEIVDGVTKLTKLQYTPFSSFPQSFPAPGSFPKSQLFASGGQSTGVSASVFVLPMNIQD